MTTETVIRVENLVKDYRAGPSWWGRDTTRALDGLDLEVRRGEVFGFLGPNGAGKTTTIRILLDLLRPTTGTAEVFGVAPRDGGRDQRARIGYLPGELSLAGRSTAGDLLHHLARLRGGGAGRIAEYAERLTLDLTREMRDLSKGNRQKVGVVQAFMHAPELLILDEPTSGLDPLLQREFQEMVREACDAGATVLMSSHVLSEVELAATRVAIIRAGRIVDVDDVATLRHRAGQQVEFVFAEPVAAKTFAGIDGVEEVEVDGSTLRCLLRGEPDALLRAATTYRVVRWSAQDRELEDLFIDFYRVPADQVRAHEETADGR
ncbi:MAG: ABC transporter ATP-binding protein [Nitriliruptoraceae bacterium]